MDFAFILIFVLIGLFLGLLAWFFYDSYVISKQNKRIEEDLKIARANWKKAHDKKQEKKIGKP